MNYFKRLHKIIKTKQEIKQAKLDLELKQSTCNHLYEYAGSKEYIDSSIFDISMRDEHVVVCTKCGFEYESFSNSEIELLINKSKIKNVGKSTVIN